MAASAGHKTRTTSAHAPNKVKKQYKQSGNTEQPQRTSKPIARSSTSAAVGDRKRKANDDDEAQPAAQSHHPQPSTLLNTPDEIDFPRGGGTNLTQVEVREAQLEGLREYEADDNDVEKEDSVRLAETEVIKDKSKAKRRKLERALQGEIKEKNKLPKDAFRVEHLNYKRLIPGTKVLAQIVAVRPLELVVSLPNQLLGHIPITNISPEFTTRLEEAGDASDEDDSDGDSADASEKSPSLSSLFKEGHWVSAIVVASKSSDSKRSLGGREGDENVRASRRVELSLEPAKVNDGVAKGDLKAGFTLTASVNSVEDHGYILSLGLLSLTSFLPYKEAQKLQSEPLQIGQIVSCRIKEVSENGRTCTVTVGRAEVAGSTLSNAASITSVLPATLVTALVTATLPSGLNVKFFGYFDGTIDKFHLNGLDPEKNFKLGQKIKARVLWDSIASTPKKFSLSISKHVVDMDIAKVKDRGVSVADLYPVGRSLAQVKIIHIDDEWGLTCEITEDDVEVAAFVHISRVTDDHLASVPKSGPWKVGSTHRARVVGYSAVDALVQLSFQPSVLDQAFLRVQDVRVGEIIKGTIKRLSDSALFISISGNVDGVVWPMHYSDIKLKHPEKKFKVGAVVKARILYTDPAKNRVVLTLKRQLIDSELPVITRASDAKPGQTTHAVITKILDSGALVDFFGGVRAIIPASEAANEYTADVSKLFTVGKVVKVRIVSVNEQTGRIVASAREPREGATATADALDNVEIGSVLSGTVLAVHDANIVLTLHPSKAKALISLAMLARHRDTTVSELKQVIGTDDTLDDLVVVSKNAEKALAIVGLVPSKASRAPTAGGEAALTSQPFESLVCCQQFTGRICGKVPTGILVQVSRSVRGRVSWTELADDYDEATSQGFSVGSHVQCRVISIDTENRRVDLSLRRSRLETGVTPVDAAVSSLDDITPGQSIRGFVKNVANHGVFVSLGGDVTARVQIKELFDEFVKDWKPRFAVGQLVSGKITAVDKVQGQVEMSLRKNAEVKASTLDFGDLEKGKVVKGVVKRVEAYGAFIRIEGSSINGLCHKTKVTDNDAIKWTDCVREGQTVRAVVMDVNKATRKVSLGLKRSLFPDDAEDTELEAGSVGSADLSGSDSSDGDEVDDLDAGMELDEDEEDEQEEEEKEEDNEDDDDEEEGELLSVSGAKIDTLPRDGAKAASAPLTAHAGFDWTGDASDDELRNSPDIDDDDDEDNSEDREATRSDNLTVSKAGDGGLATLHDKTAELDSQGPRSVADFERLLLGSPNSSYLWIQFIAYFVGLTQLEKARETGRRALKTINFREEQEKLNVWVALLNLENTYGTEASLEKLFGEAVQMNDAKTIHLSLIDIYERSSKYELEEELFKKTVKKFGSSSKVWTLFGQFYLTQGRAAEARDLLPRSLKSLEKRKHLKTISKFAQLEFRHGDAERGRTIFEGVMDSYPKRLDLWFVYIDMEIRQKNVPGVRALFDRVLVQRLSSKKGKSVFKKWLAFEKEYGDEAGVESVKAKAMAFVDSLNS